jgi:membrane protein
MGSLITLFKRSFQSFGKDRCATLSAAIAYRTIFSLFPLALVGVSLLGFFLGDESARERVVSGISGVITLGADGEAALSSTLGGVSAAKGWLGINGLLTAMWSASGLFGEMRSALNQVWDVDRPRPMLRAKLQDVLLMLGFGGLLGASTASTGVLQGAREAGAEWLGPLLNMAGPVFALLAILLPLVLTFAAFMVLYKLAPHARLSWRDVLPAAIIAALFFEFGKNLLTLYITRMGNFNALAGSLGAAILVLVFVYYASQVILLAAEVAKHRLLIRAGSVPATDPKVDKPKQSIGTKIKQAIEHLWTIPEPHHDPELPYKPSRLDPATNRPANTKELIYVKIQDAQQRANGDESAQPEGAFTLPRLSGVVFATESGVLDGAIQKRDNMTLFESGGLALPLNATDDVRVTRDEKDSSVKDLKDGDRVTIVVTKDGGLQRIYATSKAGTVPAKSEGGVDLSAAAPLLLSAYANWRQKRAKHEEQKAKRATDEAKDQDKGERAALRAARDGHQPDPREQNRAARRAAQLSR